MNSPINVPVATITTDVGKFVVDVHFMGQCVLTADFKFQCIVKVSSVPDKVPVGTTVTYTYDEMKLNIKKGNLSFR